MKGCVVCLSNSQKDTIVFAAACAILMQFYLFFTDVVVPIIHIFILAYPELIVFCHS